VLDQSFGGVLVRDFYAAHLHYPSLKQRCWAHLLGDLPDLKRLYPEDTGLTHWAEAVHQLYTSGPDLGHYPGGQGQRPQLMLVAPILSGCWSSVVPSLMTLCRSRASSIGVLYPLSRNGSSWWLILPYHLRTTLPSEAYGIW
jgi:hypothetical protein